MADENPFAQAAASPAAQAAVASAAVAAAPAMAGMAAKAVGNAMPGMQNAAQARWQAATGPPGWWWVFAIIDCVLGVTMFVNGALMVTSIASSPITVGDVSFLTTFCLGLYFCVFSVLSLISSFIWFTCLGKFIGFFYFMWGRGAFYLIFGTMSLTWPFACFDIEGGCVAVKWASVIIQFVVSCVMSVVGIVYIIMGFIPTVSKLYRPIFGDPKCRTANVVVASEEYWYGKEKFDAKYGVADMQKDPTAATAPHMQPGFNGGAGAQQAQFS